MLLLLLEHQLQDVLVHALQTDIMQLQPGLDRVVQALADYVPVCLVGLQGLDVDEALLVRTRQFGSQQVVVEHSIGPHVAFVELHHLQILLELGREVIDCVLGIHQFLFDTGGQQSRLPQLDVFILDHDPLAVDGVDGGDPHFPDLFDRQSHDVHSQVDLLLLEPASGDFPFLEIAVQVSLVAVLGDEDGLLPETVHIFHLDDELGLGLGVAFLDRLQLLVEGLDLPRFGLEHPDLGSVDPHHLLVGCVQRHVGTLLEVGVVRMHHFRRTVEQVLLYEGFGQHVHLRLQIGLELSLDPEVHITIAQDLLDGGPVLLVVVQHRLDQVADFLGDHQEERRVALVVALVVVLPLDLFQDIFFGVAAEGEHSVDHFVEDDSESIDIAGVGEFLPLEHLRRLVLNGDLLLVEIVAELDECRMEEQNVVSAQSTEDYLFLVEFSHCQQQDLQNHQGIFLGEEPVVVEDLAQGSYDPSFEEKGHVAPVEDHHVEDQRHESVLYISQGLEQSVVPGEDVQQQVPLGDLVVDLEGGVEVVLLYRSERVVLVPTSDDLALAFHLVCRCYNYLFLLGQATMTITFRTALATSISI